MGNKRRNSNLIPYKIRDGQGFVYLQKRTLDAPTLPGRLAFWGGTAAEGESSEETIKREIKEEINYVPNDIEHFKRYENENRIKDVFIVKVEDDFESHVEILEGDDGRWLSEEETLASLDIIEEHKVILSDFYNFLRSATKIGDPISAVYEKGNQTQK